MEKEMTNEEKRKIEKMLYMQNELNKAVLKEMNLREVQEDQIRFALLDEVGELTHELKGEWCWWKKTQPAPDPDKVLEELVDVWHFAMSLYIFKRKRLTLSYEEDDIADCEEKSLIELLNKTAKNIRLEPVIALTFKLGYSIDEIYDGYIAKNKVNYERIRNGY